MPHALLLILVVSLPFVASIVAGALPRRHSLTGAAFGAGATALVLLAVLALGPAVSTGEIARVAVPWIPSLQLGFSLRMDGFAWVFCVLVAGIGLLVMFYARYYMSPADPVPRFFAFLLAFMGSMLGVVLAGNLIQLAFFWELTSVFSFLLIGYWHQDPAARDGARMALVITSAGGLCLFAGALLIGQAVGSYDLDVVLGAGDVIRAHALYTPALVLVVVGALTKSAQFPFHFWLPHAMAAPTPVSAYLHSAAMVKLGVFLLARLWPVMSGTDAWMWIVGLSGLASLLLGAYLAIFQNDLKGLLAYSTMSHLGLIVLLLGLNSPLATVAAVFHTLNHATFKASLFMAAGIVDHEAGTRDIRVLSGLAKFMPLTAALAIVAAAAMAGVPLLNGFLSKEMFFAETLDIEGPAPALNRLMPWLATLWGVLSVCYSLRFIHGVFFGPPPVGLARVPGEPPRWMRFPIDLLVIACILVGVLPAVTIGPFLDVGVRALLGPDTPEYSLAVWHGPGLPFFMSMIALAAGATLYVLLQRVLRRGRGRAPLLPAIDARRVFGAVLRTVSLRWARALHDRLGTRRLQPQLRLIVLAVIVATLMPVTIRGLSWGPLPWIGVEWPLALAWLVAAACAIAAAAQAKYHRLVALLLTSGAGLIVCVTFVWFSGPDLALTQLVVEVVTSVLLLLGLRWLPRRIPFAPTWRGFLVAVPRRAMDLSLAGLIGGGLGALAYAIMTRPLPDHAISRYFMEHAWPAGGGTNVVNVIIVDFRGFDTLGEVTVLAVVATAAYALLRRFRPAAESIVQPRQQNRQPLGALVEQMFVPEIIMRAMFPAVALVSAYLLLRGHNAPGGGFVAGLTFAVAVVLQYMASGTRLTEARMPLRPVRWIAVGMLLAGATGAAAWWFGHPFLTSHTAHVEWPLIGPLHLPSAFFFDIGVFCVVVGATLLMLVALAHQSTRARRELRLPWN